MENEITHMEKQALISQMNPHFIFNCLNSIKFFILNNENNKAADFLTRFSRLMRLILENSQNDLIPLKDEIDALHLYLQLEQLRFKNKFDYRIDLEGDLPIEDQKIPPLIIQPFVENAILHGLNPLPTKGLLQIIIKVSDQQYHIQIIDNGIGRKASKEIKKNSILKKKSLGMKITQRRLELIQNSLSKSLTITDLADTYGHASGTQVDIIFSL